MELANSQKEALSLDRHLAITAGAGSGKTLVLVERYFRTLEERQARTDEILAITFTEKAAGEMKSRVLERVLQRHEEIQNEQAASSFEEIDYWEQMMETLGEASISTIHAFCGALLREFPVEAGVDPDFNILDEHDAALLRSQAVTETLRDMAENADADFEVLCNFWDYRKCVENIEHLLTVGENALRWSRKYSARETAEIKEHLNKTLQKLCRARSPHRADVEADQRVCPKNKKENNSAPHASPENATTNDPAYLIQDNFTTSFLHSLACVFSRVWELYTLSGKGNGRSLDFDDLEIYALRLLRENPQIKDIVRKRYRFIMVDEFQDVNPIQWEIIREISPFADTGGGNLFIVGDEKQSIYEFRGADVTLFKNARDKLLEANIKSGLDRDLTSEIQLDANFRSHPKLMDFFNMVFSEIFKEPDEITTRQTTIDYRQMSAWRKSGPQDYTAVGKRVEIILEINPAAPKEEREKVAAELVAKRIRHLINPDENLNEKLSGLPHFRSKDIAVLFRKRTHMKLYEEALRKCGVPFVVIGGIGFYERQEIEDILLLLDFLADPRKNAALAGILRSSFFGVSDEELFWLAREEGETLLKKLRRATDTKDPEKYSRHVGFARDCITQWQAMAGRIPTATLIRSALEDSGCYGVMGSGLRGAQSTANLQKLLHLIRGFEFSHGYNLHRTAEFLAQMRDSEPREAEASLPLEETEGVRLLTIHGSKGLEFPVVILTGLSDKVISKSAETCLIGKGHDGEYEVGIKLGEESELTSHLRTMLQETTRKREMEEAKRLLYVACTRARELLILSGFGSDCRIFDAGANEVRPTKMDRWDCWIQNALQKKGIASYDDAGIAVYDESTSDTTITPDVGANGVRPTKTEIIIPDLKYMRPLILPADRGTFTVTEIAEYVKNRESYSLQELLSIPPAWMLAAPKQVEHLGVCPDEIISPRLRGEIVHKLFENLGNGAKIELNGMFNNILSDFRITDVNERESLRLKYLPRATNFMRSSLGQQVCSMKANHEFSFIFRLRNWSVRGKMDVLFPDKGLWCILDYKTDEIDASQIPEKVEKYRVQMEIYALAAMKLLPDIQEISGAFYFVEPEQINETIHFTRSREKSLENSLAEILGEMSKLQKLSC